jgi:hypothetical protein
VTEATRLFREAASDGYEKAALALKGKP